MVRCAVTLTRAEQQLIVRQYLEGHSCNALGKVWGVSGTMVYKLVRGANVGRTRGEAARISRSRSYLGPRVGDPTLEEIAVITKSIRDGTWREDAEPWDDEEYEKRASSPVRPVELRPVKFLSSRVTRE